MGDKDKNPCLFYFDVLILVVEEGMYSMIIDVILETIIDGLKVFPFLLCAFLIIELVEHRFYRQSMSILKKAGRFGPLLGGLLGCFPQCGFSVLATNLYVTRIITLGTLISVYLSTSDEMLPILIARGGSFRDIIFLLGIKLIIGMASGFIIDFLFRRREKVSIRDLCEEEHCHCEKGLFVSSLKHTIHTLVFILGVSFLLNIVMVYGGKDFLSEMIGSNSFVALFVTSMVGLIPNCASSVVITELYLSGVLSISSTIAGLLTGSGVALLVLFKANKDIKENIRILLLVYFIGVVSGLVFELVSYWI